MRQIAFAFAFAALMGVFLDAPFEFIGFLLIAASMMAALGRPSKDQRDARRRNHAHRVR